MTVYTPKYFKDYKKARVTKFDLAPAFWKEFYKLPLNAKVLDVGVGPGIIMQLLMSCRSDLDYYGIDPGEIDTTGIAYTYKKGGAENIPFEDNTFDLILCTSVLEHIIDNGKAVKEMNRVLKEGGIIYLTVPNPKSLWFPDSIYNFYSDYGHIRPYTKSGLRRMFSEYKYTPKVIGTMRNRITVLIAPYLIIKSLIFWDVEIYSHMLANIIGCNIFIIAEKKDE